MVIEVAFWIGVSRMGSRMVARIQSMGSSKT